MWLALFHGSLHKLNDLLLAHSLFKVKLDDSFSGGNKVANKEPLEWGLCYK